MSVTGRFADGKIANSRRKQLPYFEIRYMISLQLDWYLIQSGRGNRPDEATATGLSYSILPN